MVGKSPSIGLRHLSILLLIICLASSLLAQAAASLSIPVTPLSRDMRRLPIRVYWMDGSCTPEEREIIKSGLDIALGILAGAAAKLEEDYPEGFMNFGSLRFVKVSDIGVAQIIVTDADVGTGGRTSLTISDKWIIPPAKVEIGCDLASIGLSAVIVVTLHELGHALGLGHTSFQEYGGVYELMYPVITRATYPSTLDLYAIYQLVIKGYDASSINLPDWLPYAQVSPQGLLLPGEEESGREETATLSELERKIQDLERKFGSLEDKILNLESDVQVIEQRLRELEERVAALENRSNTLEERMSEAERGLVRASESVDQLNASLMLFKNMTKEQTEVLKNEIKNIGAGLEELGLNLSQMQREWAKNFTDLMEKQAVLKWELISQKREFDEKLLDTSQEINRISHRTDNISSEVEELKLKISYLEKALEDKDLEIMRLNKWNKLLLLLSIAAIILSIVALIQGRKKAREEGSGLAPAQETT